MIYGHKKLGVEKNNVTGMKAKNIISLIKINNNLCS